jgi:hypothetical protein
VFAAVEDVDDVRMRQAGGGLRLALEPLDELGVLRKPAIPPEPSRLSTR